MSAEMAEVAGIANRTSRATDFAPSRTVTFEIDTRWRFGGAKLVVVVVADDSADAIDVEELIGVLTDLVAESATGTVVVAAADVAVEVIDTAGAVDTKSETPGASIPRVITVSLVSTSTTPRSISGASAAGLA
jgi:hypothetical protein